MRIAKTNSLGNPHFFNKKITCEKDDARINLFA